MLGAGSDPAGYHLSRQANCPAEYYLGAEPAGRWLGAGAAAAGLNGWVDSAGATTLRDLLAGTPPGTEGVPAPTILRADPRGRLEAKPLTDTTTNRAEQQGVPPVELFAQPADRAAWTGLAARVERPRRGRPATVSPARARRLAEVAGLDVRAVYRAPDGADRYAAAVRFADRRVDVRRPGVDVTISAPKSVSVLFGLGNEDTSSAVRAAHHAAVGEALAYLESVAGHGLRGHQRDGHRAAHIGTDGWIVAAFEHRTSRAGDPQLHTHLVVPNLLHGADGKWSAIDTKSIYRHALTASYLYHAVLRAELTRRLGVAWTAPVKGIAEINGIPSDLLDTFSTRRKQIETAMTAAGTSGPDAAQAACLATRPAKPAAVPEQSLRDRWATTARAAGHDPGKLMAAVPRGHRAPVMPSVGQLAAHLLGPSGLTAQATGFDRRDLLQALCQCLPAGTATDQARVEAIADQVLASRDVVRLVSPVDEGARWSTTELLAVEQHALRTASQLHAVPDRETPPDQAAETWTGRLSGEQQAMVRALAGAEGLAVVVGPAGAGKTAALTAAVDLWTAQGRAVTGAAVAAVTARRLEHATGAPSTSLTWLLHTVRRMNPATRGETGLPRGGVLVVDEASMVDTRTLALLLHHTREAQATLVLVGDPAQLPEIGAGGLFVALAHHPATITLTDNRRQTQAWERRALSDLRAGDPEAAVTAYAEHQRVHTAPADQLPDRIVEDYLRLLDQPNASPAGDEPGERVVMLAVRRADVTALNDTTRTRLLAEHRLGPDAVTAGHGHLAREYRAGDRVLVTANDHRLGLLNGTRATVTALDTRTQTISLRDEDRQQVTVTADWATCHLDHGYAMTCHKAQGATVDTALLYGAGALTREAGYVALSRGRTANHLYAPESDDTQPAAWPEDDEHLDRLAARPRRPPRPDPRQPTAPRRRARPVAPSDLHRPIQTSRRDLPMTVPLLLTPTEAAAALGIGRSKLYELMQDGIVESIHIGTCRRIPVDALTTLVADLRGKHERAAAG